MKQKKKSSGLLLLTLALVIAAALSFALPYAAESESSPVPQSTETPLPEATPEVTDLPPAEEENPEKRKMETLSILGDSYSAFRGYTEPESNVTYYPISDPCTEGRANDVEQVEEMWWYLFAEEYGLSIVRNDSYSGSPVCYDGHFAGPTDAKDYSYVARCRSLRGADLIIIEGATNDSSVGAALGEYQYADWEEQDFAFFRPACAYVISTIQNANPSSTVIFLLNCGLRADITESVLTICEHYEVPVLQLENISKQNMHPSVEGMMQIKDQLIAFLEELDSMKGLA